MLERLKDLVDRLALWRGTAALGAREVLAWPTAKGQIAVAFRGDALKMTLRLLKRPLPNRPVSRDTWIGNLDVDMSRVLDLDLGQMFTIDEIYPYDFMNGVESAAAHFLGVDEGGVYVTLMPLQGEPWVLGVSKTIYVSSRKPRPTTNSTRPQLVELDLDPSRMAEQDIEEPIGIDICSVATRITSCDSGAVVAELNGTHILVAHSFDLVNLRFAEAAAMVKSCGGLAMPSLAVGIVPATGFGQVVLLADVGIILPSLRPYKRTRGNWPIVLYETDAWTATSRQIFLVGAHELFMELTGQPVNWTYRNHFWVLGVPVDDGRARLIDSTKKLSSVLRRRLKPWVRSLDAAAVERVQDTFDKERYPYVEAKSNGIVPMSCFPLAVCPEEQKKDAAAFLKGTGWRGKLLTVDYPSYPLNGHVVDGRDVRWDYAWAVRDAVLAAKQSVFRLET